MVKNKKNHTFRLPKVTRLFEKMGPGIITGAADDDPSGIATYSQAGATFGNALVWSTFFTVPLMISIQWICAQIALVTRQGLAANLQSALGKKITISLVILLLTANILNLAADLSAMADVTYLLVGGSKSLYAILFGCISVYLQVILSYEKYAKYLKWATLSLFAYVVCAFKVHLNWSDIAQSIFSPLQTLNSNSLQMIVAVLGTTISPYLFFWQSSQEIEELNDSQKINKTLKSMQIETVFGMIFSNLIAFFIMTTCAATLHKNGILQIETSAQAAEALRPIAGSMTFFLFSLGIIGTGFLAIPVLAGSAAYAISDCTEWKQGLNLKFRDGLNFYTIIILATFLGILIDLIPLDPIKALYWSAVLNGVISVPIIFAVLFLTLKDPNKKSFGIPRYILVLGLITALMMTGMVLGMFSVDFLQIGYFTVK